MSKQTFFLKGLSNFFQPIYVWSNFRLSPSHETQIEFSSIFDCSNFVLKLNQSTSSRANIFHICLFVLEAAKHFQKCTLQYNFKNEKQILQLCCKHSLKLLLPISPLTQIQTFKKLNIHNHLSMLSVQLEGQISGYPQQVPLSL